jgi:hypothetical protein
MAEGLFGYLLRKATGKRRSDIELPNESGEVDSRIPRVGESFRKAADTLSDLTDDSSGGNAVERLQAAGRKALEREKRKKFDEENRRALGR